MYDTQRNISIFVTREGLMRCWGSCTIASKFLKCKRNMTAAVLAASATQSHSGRPPRRWRRPPTLTATSCVFELIKTTTPALVVKKKPAVDVGAARHREALRCAHTACVRLRFNIMTKL